MQFHAQFISRLTLYLPPTAIPHLLLGGPRDDDGGGFGRVRGRVGAQFRAALHRLLQLCFMLAPGYLEAVNLNVTTTFTAAAMTHCICWKRSMQYTGASARAPARERAEPEGEARGAER